MVSEYLLNKLKITRNWDYEQQRAYYLSPYIIIRDVNDRKYRLMLNQAILQMSNEGPVMGKSFYELLAQFINEEPYKDRFPSELDDFKSNFVMLANYLVNHNKNLESHIPLDTIHKSEHKARVSMLNYMMAL
jgi:hypothetical protein